VTPGIMDLARSDVLKRGVQRTQKWTREVLRFLIHKPALPLAQRDNRALMVNAVAASRNRGGGGDGCVRRRRPAVGAPGPRRFKGWTGTSSRGTATAPALDDLDAPLNYQVEREILGGGEAFLGGMPVVAVPDRARNAS